MARQVVILAGPAGTGKTTQALKQYHQAADRAEPGSLLWIAPNWRAVEEIRAGVLRERVGYLAPGIMTFDRFAEAVVEYSGQRARLMDGWMQRWLIWELVEEVRRSGGFRYFAQIAHTAGFVDLLCTWIQEMKRLEIWPEQFHQACQAKGMTDKDQELLHLYQAYQGTLTQSDLYDGEGRFWLARTLLADDALLPPAQRHRLQLVVVDGFTDFTRTQHEILEHLARRTDCLLITLPLEKDPGREDLFAKPRKTLEELRRRHQDLRLEWLDRPEKPSWPGLDHIERHLFANPRQYRPLAQKAERIEILAAASPLAEIQLLAKRIKQLLTEGPPSGTGPVRPDEILVLFRSLEPVAEFVREVFGRYGIPFALESSMLLRSARSLLALVELMGLQTEDWPFRRLLAVLNHSYFQPDWSEWQQGRGGLLAEQILRRLQIPQGRDQLFQALHHLANSEDPEAPQAQSTLALLERLAGALDALPEKAPLSEWARAWKALASQVGILQAIPTQPTEGHRLSRPFSPESPSQRSPQTTREQSAWQQMEDLLGSADQLWSWLGRSAPQLDRQEALAVLIDLVQRGCLPGTPQEAGRVRVLSVRTARPLRAAYVFLAGLSEKSFPSPEPVDRFYSEQETQQFIQQELPLAARRDQTWEEMLLFYEAITRADQQLVLSYPGLDETAQPLAPSPYLEEMEAVCGPGQIEKKELFELRPIPNEEELFCPRDFRLRAMADAMEGKVDLLAGLVQSPTDPSIGLPSEAEASPRSVGNPGGARERSPGPGGLTERGPLGDSFDQGVEEVACVAEEIFTMPENILAAVRLMADRSDPKQFGPGEGIFQTAAALGALKERFGAEYVYSASGLEKYAACGFRFLVEEVLGLKPPEELELDEDSAQRGQLTHQILAEVHRRLNEQVGQPTSPAEVEEAQWNTLLQQVVDQTFARRPQEPVQAALWEVHRRRISQWLAEYRRHHQNYDQANLWEAWTQKPKPKYFEVAFGLSESDGVYGALELVPPPTAKADLPKVRISGRIDRIDVGQAAGKQVFNILDYKTGQANWPSSRGSAEKLQAQLQQGILLQLPLYLLAAERLVLANQQAKPCFAAYWKIKDPGKTTPLSGFQASQIEAGNLVATDTWNYIQKTIIQTVFRLVHGVRSGQFPVWNPDPNCTRNCPWKTACRIQQVRALKTLVSLEPPPPK